ncbi:MAG: long-chain-fatty-acid--CoA ligase [Pigmentiphaga sp.]|nr:long-chain-fatty-acid--CoA ligase [Pigmentiphaga sp.]
MNRPWLSQYPPDVPAEIPAERPASLVDLMETAFARYADRQAFHFLGASLSYADTDRLSRDFAAWLQHEGLSQGARVAVMMPNVLSYMVVVAGILRAGYVVVNTNPLYTPRELRHQLADSGAEAIVILENFASVLAEVLPQTSVHRVVVATMGDLTGTLKRVVVNTVVRHVKKLVPRYQLRRAHSLTDALRQGRSLSLTRCAPTADDLAFLQYTGGTTGLAKGAMLTHGNIVANVTQAELWFAPILGRAGEGPQLRIVAALPLYHIFALMASGMYAMHMGMCNLLIPNPRDLKAVLADLHKFPPHLLPAVNTLFNGLLNHPDFAKVDWSKLKLALGGGMAVQRAVAERWHAATGLHLLEAYGLSETSPAVTINPVTLASYNGTIGVPIPSTDVKLVDHEGQAVAEGEAGELAVKGPQVMAGYWNMPDETAQAMTADGYFKTGDIARIDEQGYVRIVDRKKDMILVSGFNVYPNEVEGEVAQHPGVLEVAAIGIPDEHSGEAVKLYVVRKDPNLTEDELRAFCRERLTGYKRPRVIEFRDELPKTNVGKILRRALRDEALASQPPEGG